LHGENEDYLYIGYEIVTGFIMRIIDTIINNIDGSNNFNMSMYADLAE
jgi:hypothetical protein